LASDNPAIVDTDYLEFADWDAAVTAYNSEEWEAALGKGVVREQLVSSAVARNDPPDLRQQEFP
jgi:hypothetical protein